ncbi:MAG TPA: hypothetical protein VFJ12_06950, partial [Segeticoccus sp.]|nr:hypothetical protein [Segeticoccus sp.]
MTRYDPHPQAHDDARSTPSGFTDRRESDENGSGVPQPLTREAADGLRGALEALADGFADTWAQRRADADREPPGTTQQHVDVAAGQAWWVAERNLRAVLAAHPADAPAEGRSGSGAARVVPVEVLEELAERWRRKQVGAQRSAMAAIEFTKSFDPVLDLWAVITAHATTVDPETTRSGFTGATESDERAVSVSVDADAGERRTEAQGTPWGPSWHAMNATPGDSAGAESVSAVEQAARVLHAWDVEDGPCAGPWEALTDAQREVWRSGAQALADHGLLVPDDYPSNPEGSWRP